MALKRGDTVQLISGGPVMTVATVPEPGQNKGNDGQIVKGVLCIWFHDGVCQEKLLAVDLLKLVVAG